MKGLPEGTEKEWLLIKKNDTHARKNFKLPSGLAAARLTRLKVRLPPCETE